MTSPTRTQCRDAIIAAALELGPRVGELAVRKGMALASLRDVLYAAWDGVSPRLGPNTYGPVADADLPRFNVASKLHRACLAADSSGRERAYVAVHIAGACKVLA